MIVNERIRQIREYRRLRSKDLARLAHLSTSGLSQIETGKKPTPRIDSLQKIAAALEVTVAALLPETYPDPFDPARVCAVESFALFARETSLEPGEEAAFMKICKSGTAPDTVRGWKALRDNIETFISTSHQT
jgi:transcriptional regulator with XRE-family HTH domain